MTTTRLELSKELYAVSGWETDSWTHPDEEYLLTYEDVTVGYGGNIRPGATAAYDLGYLLRKLPYEVIDNWAAWVYGFKLMPTASTGWKIWYGEVGTDSEMYFNSADNPEDAVAMLIIELFKNGILTREKE
jgi:hypothetical protein